jgi:hypothetical protein
MTKFVPNAGQFHPDVAYVAKFSPEEYRGAGVVRLLLNGPTISGVEDVDHIFMAEAQSEFPNEPLAMSSGGECVVMRGTAAAALLNLTRKTNVVP